MYKNKNKTMNIIIIVISILAVLMLIVAIGFLVFNKVKDSGTEELNSTIETTTSSTISTTITITPTTTTGTTTPTTTTTTPPNVKTGNENFEITQWGVTGYYNGSAGVSYQITAKDTYYMVSFSSEDFSGSCSGQTVLYYERLASNDNLTHNGNLAITPTNVVEWYNTNPSEHTGDAPFIRKIGDYYYTYTVSMLGACDEGGNDSLIQTDIMSGMRNHFNTLVSV